MGHISVPLQGRVHLATVQFHKEQAMEQEIPCDSANERLLGEDEWTL